MSDSAPDLARDAAAPRRRARGWLILLRDIVVIVLIAILVSFLVKTFLVRSFYIPSGSMEETLQEQDRILVDEITPRFSGYDRGDVVVFRPPAGASDNQCGHPSLKPGIGFYPSWDWRLPIAMITSSSALSVCPVITSCAAMPSVRSASMASPLMRANTS